MGNLRFRERDICHLSACDSGVDSVKEPRIYKEGALPDNQQTSFVVDGNNWSGEVVNGGSLLLELNNDDNRKEWSITLKPEIFVSDYHNIAGTISEFHIIALNDGKGEMVFQCTNDDGRTDKYILELSISRHQKNISKLIPL